MTGKERILRSLEFKEADRVPVFPLAHYYTARSGGMTVRAFATDGGKMAAALLAGFEKFGWDGLNPGCDVSVEGEALGSSLGYPEEAPPHLLRPALEDPGNLRLLRRPNPLREGRMPVVVQATRLCVRELGSGVFIGPFIMGPFNCASQVRGVEDLMTDTLERPGFVEELLDFCTDVLVDYGKALVDVGADAIFLGEALCSPAMISPKFYSEIVLPRQRRLVGALRSYGAPHVLLHICGNVRQILPAMLESGADIFDLDWQMDMADSKRTCLGRAALRGNLDPSATLLQGTSDQVYKKSVEIIRAAASGGGLILGSGCDVSPGTPEENLHAMMAASRDASPCQKG
jgi:uroporphyrinogen decarboxylase